MAVALDSDAVIAFLDRSDSLHSDARKQLGEAVNADTLVASAVTYAEVLEGAAMGHHDEEAVRQFFSDLVSKIVPVDKAVAESAALLRARTKLRMPDALVLSSALMSPDVSALITGDKRLAQAAGPDLRVHLLKDRPAASRRG